MPITGVTSRHMYTLYKQMIELLFGNDGCDPTLSANMGYPVQAHHCISCSVMEGYEGGALAKLARDSGYDINNGGNGIALPAYFGHMRKGSKQRHRGGHWDRYYKAVENELKPIYMNYEDAKPCQDPEARKNILGELQAVEKSLKGQLENKTLWLYDWSESLYNGDYRDEGTGEMMSSRTREGSSTSGLQWLKDFSGAQAKRRHESKQGHKSVLSSWYASYGYPVPDNLTS